jgi:hypothetical protein
MTGTLRAGLASPNSIRPGADPAAARRLRQLFPGFIHHADNAYRHTPHVALLMRGENAGLEYGLRRSPGFRQFVGGELAGVLCRHTPGIPLFPFSVTALSGYPGVAGP